MSYGRQVGTVTHGVVVRVPVSPEPQLDHEPFAESLVLLELPDRLSRNGQSLCQSRERRRSPACEEATICLEVLELPNGGVESAVLP